LFNIGGESRERSKIRAMRTRHQPRITLIDSAAARWKPHWSTLRRNADRSASLRCSGASNEPIGKYANRWFTTPRNNSNRDGCDGQR
jgi:hypothetical protein